VRVDLSASICNIFDLGSPASFRLRRPDCERLQSPNNQRNYIVKLKVKIIMYTGGTDIIMYYLIVERVNYNLLELPQNIVGEL
jgi:hypothetical protein